MMYAEIYGVSEELEPLAQYVQWADSGKYADPNTAYNLRQFWDAKSKFTTSDPDLQWGILVLDAHSQYILGHVYLAQIVNGTPDAMPASGRSANAAFVQAQSEFSDAGLESWASRAKLQADQTSQWVTDMRLNYIDDSLATAVRDQANKVLEGAGKALDFAGSPWGMIAGLVVLGAVAVAVIKGRR